PESGKIDRMHDDSRAQELVCLATPNLPEFLTVNVLSPQNAKNQKKPAKWPVSVFIRWRSLY
ncbi:hypothetical protein, partial [Aeromonas australiensis]|uniref:hypothetical protein n=1 Tax=Aeromonas australiensis TaxID=1114880 RepID=UPI001F3D31B4